MSAASGTLAASTNAETRVMTYSSLHQDCVILIETTEKDVLRAEMVFRVLEERCLHMAGLTTGADEHSVLKFVTTVSLNTVTFMRGPGKFSMAQMLAGSVDKPDDLCVRSMTSLMGSLGAGFVAGISVRDRQVCPRWCQTT